METPSSVLTRWIKRNQLNLPIDRSEVLSLLEREYFTSSSRSEKSAILRYLQAGLDPKNFTWEIARLCLTKAISNAAEKGHTTFKDRVGTEVVSKIKSNAAKKGVDTRIQRFIDEGMSKKDAISRSYNEACLKKGRRIANELDIEIDGLSVSEISKLSGLKKRISFSKLSSEEKEKRRVIWKRSVLQNKSVILTLQKEYPDFLAVALDTEELVNKWYSIYNSIRSSETITNGRGGKGYGISGYHTSSKTGKTYFYRSSLERKFLTVLDDHPKILHYEVEPYHIKLPSESRYVPDVVATSTTGKRIIFEVKPEFKLIEFMASKGTEISSLYDNFYIITCKMMKDLEKLNEHVNQICQFH